MDLLLISTTYTLYQILVPVNLILYKQKKWFSKMHLNRDISVRESSFCNGRLELKMASAIDSKLYTSSSAISLGIPKESTKTSVQKHLKYSVADDPLSKDKHG